VAYPEQIVGLLVTEKVRGLGAQLVNDAGERFIFELETRDTVSAAIIRECHQRHQGLLTNTGMHGLWLDSPMIEMLKGEGTIARALPAMFRQYMQFGIDMRRQPILIYPTQHYQNGGLLINEQAETAVPNLYAAGEVSGGVHGRNRLMGNSLLDILVFGRRAGIDAVAKLPGIVPGDLSLEHVRAYRKRLGETGKDTGRQAPMLLPDYRRPEARELRHEATRAA
jgi:succinate dehydrogenase / fumarate reductase flavoprotein subunit